MAQGRRVLRQSGTDGAIVVRGPDSADDDRDRVISRGATGADTIETDSPGGGNAGRAEQAIPNGSAGGP